MKIAIPLIFNNYDFSRASVANYYDANGMLVEAKVDELRLGYNPTTLEFIGPIIEAAVTNELLQSYRYDLSPWEGLSGGFDITYPSGLNFLTGTNIASLFRGGAVHQEVSAGLKVFSVYFKPDASLNSVHFEMIMGSTHGRFIFRLGDFVSTALDTSQCNIEICQDGWFRVSIWANLLVSNYAQIQYHSGMFAPASHSGYICAAQVEITTPQLGFLPTSWINTGPTTVRRAADFNEDKALKVISSNVPENDHPLWVSGKSYVATEQTMVLGHYHRIYESVGANIDKYPPDHPEEWVDQGATNRWRMFDMSVGSDRQTISVGSDNTVHVLLGIDQLVNSVTLLNVYASSVKIIMRDQLGNIVYDFWRDLLSGVYESTWWSFFFGTRTRITSLSLTNLPPHTPSTIEMILEGGDDAAKIGKMIVSKAVDIGCTRYGTSVGIIDFSKKERNPFGDNFIVKRRYVDRVEFDIQILTSRVDEIKKMLADVRATPVLYIGDDGLQSTTIYGFYRDFSIVVSGPRRSDATLPVEGI